MDELEHLGVEAEAVNRRILVAMAILAVANHGMVDALHMHTDLVGTAGLEVELDKRYGQLLVILTDSSGWLFVRRCQLAKKRPYRYVGPR